MAKAKYYLAKNSCGYYEVRFVNQVTGKILFKKSTHTRTMRDAILMAEKWLNEGVPMARVDTRLYDADPSAVSPVQTISITVTIAHHWKALLMVIAMSSMME